MASSHAEYEREILIAMGADGIAREFEEHGGRLAGPSAGRNGWRTAHAIDRDDNDPSAALCVHSSNGCLGKFKDSGSGEKSIGFFETLARLRPDLYRDFREARRAMAAKYRVELPGKNGKHGRKKSTGSKATAKPAELALDQLKFHDAGALPIRAQMFADHKRGITVEAIIRAGARAAMWIGQYPVLEFQGRLSTSSPQIASSIYRSNGVDFPAAPGGNPQARKVHVIAGSQLAIVPLCSWADVAAAETIIVAEGITDGLTIAANAPAGFAVVTATDGCGSFSRKNIPAELLENFRGKRVLIVFDCDHAGQAGAKDAAKAIATTAAEVKIVKLPYPITDKHGKDARDFFAGDELFEVPHTFAEFMAIADATAAEPAGVVVTSDSTTPASEADSDDPAAFTNAIVEKVDDETITTPLTMKELKADAFSRTEHWPRRVGTSLFVHDTAHGVNWLDSTPGLYGWLAEHVGRIDWHRTRGCITKEEFYHELRRVAIRYRNVEVLPHEPLIADHYYACEMPEAGDGSTVAKLLEFFAPEDAIDRDLLLALLLTMIWGGPGGSRPVFVITSTVGRGAGKSKAAEKLAEVSGGTLSFSSNEDINGIKARLLSPEALTKRIALLDNVKSLKFSWGELEAIVTAPEVSGKKMYVGEATRPNTITWIITLNGASLSTDMAQRSIVVKVGRPSYSGDWEADVSSFIRDNRLAIIADLIGILRGPADRLRRHSRWGAWEKAILSRLPEPEDAQRVILERQAAVDVEGEEAEMLEEFTAEQLAKLSYDVESDRVHIPSETMCRWFNWAHNQSERTGAATRMLKQLHDEGRLKRLAPNKCRTHGRGFVWTGKDADPNASVWYELKERLAEQAARKKENQ